MNDLTPSGLPFLAGVLVSGAFECEPGAAKVMSGYGKALASRPRLAQELPDGFVAEWAETVEEVVPNRLSIPPTRMLYWFEYRWPWPESWHPFNFPRLGVCIELTPKSEGMRIPPWFGGFMGLDSLDELGILATAALVGWDPVLETARQLCLTYYVYGSDGFLLKSALSLTGLSPDISGPMKKKFAEMTVPTPPLFMTGPAWAATHFLLTQMMEAEGS